MADKEKPQRERVQVVVRYRPMSHKELTAARRSCVRVFTQEGRMEVRGPGKRGPIDTGVRAFAFDRVYDSSCTQQQLYQEVARPVVESVMHGYNGTVLAYGQTASGKTFTMEGFDDQPEENYSIQLEIHRVNLDLPGQHPVPCSTPSQVTAEEVSGWRYLEEDPSHEKNVALLPSNPAVLPPFELAGPVELWIQNSKDLRLAVPNEVDAGTVNRVLLADGATVTVTGAREVSVTKPFKVPLPLVKNGDTTSLSSLSEQLRFASRAYDKPVLSLRIVGATSLAASAPPPKHLDKPASSTRGLSSLKVKRLSPGAVELVNKAQEQTILPAVDGSSGSSWLWPLPSVHDSDAKVRNLDKALELSLGPNAGKKGFFNLLNAKASAARFIKVEFELEKRIDNQSLASWPEWRTKPSVQRLRFEVVAKLEDNNKVVPVAVKPVDPFVVFPAFDVSEASYNSNSNMTSTPTSIFLPPSSPLTMDFNNWDDI